VVLSIEDYRAFVAQKPDLRAYLLDGPKIDDFSVERERGRRRPSRFLDQAAGYLLDPWRG
jgi:hypothetical protein